MSATAARQFAAESIGTALLVATVVGSGIMAERLAGGNVALALLGNTLATGCMLVVLILVFGSISGAHFNPTVSVVFAMRREISISQLTLYVVAQFLGAIAGAILAHAMFDALLLQTSSHARTGAAIWLSEVVATFGLIGTILAVSQSKPGVTAYAVGLYISGAYWFTASTSFANPAVVAARSMTDTFAGIRPENVLAFVVAELLGAVGALLFFSWLLKSEKSERVVHPTLKLEHAASHDATLTKNGRV